MAYTMDAVDHRHMTNWFSSGSTVLIDLLGLPTQDVNQICNRHMIVYRRVM